MSNINELRNIYYEIVIGEKHKEEKVWVKKLRNILEADIHKKPLGCLIKDAHIRIGEVHLEAFYEAQILFSHPRWIDRFSFWIKSKIKNLKGKILIIGYETYIEPVLFSVKDKCNKHVDYAIFEKPKYIRRNVISEKQIRYKQFLQKEYDNIVFVCGISSTLSTFVEMKDFCIKQGYYGKRYSFLSVIQVLPENSNVDNSFNLDNDKILSWDEQNGINKCELKKEDNIQLESEYLIKVFCKWHLAKSCLLCYPREKYKEVPIIKTSETSVIPIQMVDGDEIQTFTHNGDNDLGIDFFAAGKESSFKYMDYLYYNHIDRDDHHYKYYIKTGDLFYKIYYDRQESRQFKNFCKKIKRKMFLDNTENKNIVNIILAPSHFSNELFSNAINKEIFDGNAHIISFDPKKEFRSNFETKFSNLAYFLEQIPKDNNENEIRFHYVDDQLISGSTFYRAKSLITSLMQNAKGQLPNCVKVFHDIILMVNRNSDSTKKDYINDTDKYYAFIDIKVPSFRSYGDSCPSCKTRQQAQEIIETCALTCVLSYWNDKRYNYRVKSLKEAKEEMERESSEDHKVFQERRFRRFYYENLYWEKIKEQKGKDKYKNIAIELLKKVNLEEAISIIKALTSPFVYYRENAKKISLKILLLIIETLLNFNDNDNTITIQIGKDSCQIVLNNEQERYIFLQVIINCLSSIDSTYLLDIDNLKKIYKKFSILAEKIEGKGIVYQDYISTILIAYKRIICGIAGDNKCNKMLYLLEKEITKGEPEFKDLFIYMYLESINTNGKDSIESFCRSSEDVLKRYKEICNSFVIKANREKKIIEQVNLFYEDNKMHTDDMEGKIYKVSEHVEDRKKIWDMERLKERGCFIKENVAIIDLRYFSDVEAMDKNKEYLKKENVYLEIKFEEFSQEIEKIKALREILKCRYSLALDIRNNLDNGKIKSAIQAEIARKLLQSDKTRSHGRSEDLNSLFLITKAFLLDQKNNIEDDKRYVEIARLKYLAIEQLMNRLISYGASKQIYKSYYGGRIEEDVPLCKMIGLNLADSVNAGELFNKQFRQYLLDLNNPTSAMGQILLEKAKNRDRDEFIKVKILIKNIDKILEKEELSNFNISDYIDFVPKCMNVEELEESALWLIGFINILLFNAVKHGEIKNNEIIINLAIKTKDDKYYERNESKTKKSCVIEIQNEKPLSEPNNEKEIGITSKFKDYFNSISTPCGVYVNLSMDNGTGNQDEYISKLELRRF